MKILHLAMQLDAALGGSSTASYTDIVAEQRAGIDSTVVFASGNSDAAGAKAMEDALRDEGVTVHRFPRLMRPAAASAQFGLSPAALKWVLAHAHRFDLIHAHGPWGFLTAGGLAIGRLRGTPTLTTAMESFTVHDRDTSKSGVRAAAKTAAWRLFPMISDFIVYTSELEKSGSPTRGRLGSRIIWHAVVDERLERPTRSIRESNDLVVGFLGRFDQKKNLPLLIRAVALDPRLHLQLAGAGGPEVEAELLALAAERGVRDRVTFTGYLNFDERAAFLNGLDVLALPSDYENFGMAAAEALQYGVPVLLGPNSGIAEVVGEGPGSRIVDLAPESIASAAADLAISNRSVEAAAAAQNLIADHLSYGAHAARALAVYDELRGLR